MVTDVTKRRAEWRARWPVVLACFIGISFPAAAIYSLGLFMEPMTREFGWSRAQFSAGASMSAALSIPFAPLAGAMIDRWGVRRFALPGIVMTGLAVASFGFANGSHPQWLGLWACFSCCVLWLKTTTWVTAISGNFTAGRSFALAVALSGSALATAVAPPATWWLIETLGWRQAWTFVSLGWGLPAFILCFLFLFDARDVTRKHSRGANGSAGPPGELPGLTVGQAMRSIVLFRIGLSTLLVLLLTAALVVHKVPLLVELGTARETAAWLAGLSGVAALAGSLTAGWLMDRMNAGLIGGATNVVTAASLVLLLEPFRTPTLVVCSMLMVGFASGAKLEICAYLTSIYAGLRNYGKIFGVMASIVAVTTATGPLLGGLIYDLTGSYDMLIVGAIPACLVAALLIFGLGPYPDWNQRPGPVLSGSG